MLKACKPSEAPVALLELLFQQFSKQVVFSFGKASDAPNSVSEYAEIRILC